MKTDVAQSGSFEALASSLNDAQRAMLTSGSGPWTTPPIPEMAIPALKMTDGMQGARGNRFSGTTSACFPCGPALASSWDPELVRRVGQALATEVRLKNARVLLAPVLNLHRHPFSGRNFEAFSEDPVLTARLGVGYIRGVQERGVAAVAKHFVANDAEVDRERVVSRVDERTLREVYLVPFEAAVRQGEVWAVMTAYNRLNDIYCSEHRWLLEEVLRREWGFVGVVMSDWGGTHSAVPALTAGLDIEMPGPPRHLGRKLLDVLTDGERPALEAAASRVLRLLDRTGADEADAQLPERSDDLPEQRAVAREAAERGIVLLSNRGVLPLSGERLTRVAVIGPAAACTPIQGGGSAGVNPHRSVSVLDGLRAALGPDVVIDHEPGTTNAKHAPLLDASQIRTPDGEPGIAIEYVDVRSGQIVGDEILPTSGLVSVGPPAPVPLAELRIRAHARFTPLVSGPHTFGLMSAGHCVVRLDGAVLLDSTDAPRGGETFFGRGTKEIIAEVMLTAGLEHEISLDVVPVMEPSETVGFLLGCHAPVDPGSMDRAVKAARRADVAIVVVGTSGEWETEGGDRDSLDLPGRQDELVRKVAAANPHSIVVLACGSPVATPWIDDVGACLVAWFGGQEVGDAVAAVLLGEVAPSGRLPVTFPADATQLLDLGFDGATITYHEGTAVGYRRYERDGLSPRFAFGHGLTYTTFEYGSVEVKQRAGAIELACSVRNTGARAGAEVIQVYVRELSPVPELRRLIEFVRCEIEPGQSREVRFVLTSPDLRRWDEERHQWRAPHGPIEVSVGRSAADTRSVTIAEFA